MCARCNEEVLCLENRRRHHRRKQLKIKIRKLFPPPPSRRRSLCRGAKNEFLMPDNMSCGVCASDERAMESNRLEARRAPWDESLSLRAVHRFMADSRVTSTRRIQTRFGDRRTCVRSRCERRFEKRSTAICIQHGRPIVDGNPLVRGVVATKCRV